MENCETETEFSNGFFAQTNYSIQIEWLKRDAVYALLCQKHRDLCSSMRTSVLMRTLSACNTSNRFIRHPERY